MNIVIDFIFGWDTKKGCSKSSPGFFGFTKAWFGSTEAQNSLNLHCHFLLWIEGMPTTLKDFQAKCDNAQLHFKSLLLNYVTSRITNSLPIDPITHCPTCKTGLLIKKELTKAALEIRRPWHFYEQPHQKQLEGMYSALQNVDSIISKGSINKLLS